MSEFFDDELTTGMQQELQKYAADEKQPNLAHAAECLHAALEILEEQGLQAQADQLLQVLQKVAQAKTTKPTIQAPSVTSLMREGFTNRDLMEFRRGSNIAVAKLNLAMSRLGYSESARGQVLGTKAMSEDAAEYILGLQKIAQKKTLSDPHTKGLTPDRMVANLKDHGTEFNMANDKLDVPSRKNQLTKDDMDADFAGMLDFPTFDIDASDDELLGIEIKEDSLEVFDKDIPLTDFEDERD